MLVLSIFVIDSFNFFCLKLFYRSLKIYSILSEILISRTIIPCTYTPPLLSLNTSFSHLNLMMNHCFRSFRLYSHKIILEKPLYTILISHIFWFSFSKYSLLVLKYVENCWFHSCNTAPYVIYISNYCFRAVSFKPTFELQRHVFYVHENIKEIYTLYAIVTHHIYL